MISVMDFGDAEINAILAELNAQTDRGVAIIAAALVDDALCRALEQRLILTNKLKQHLFSYESNGPLATFNTKIDMAYAIGLIGSETRTDLHNIRRIRNQFAHHFEPITFEHPDVRPLCLALKAAVIRESEEQSKTPRFRFKTACLLRMMALMISSKAPKIEPLAWADSLVQGLDKMIDHIMERQLKASREKS